MKIALVNQPLDGALPPAQTSLSIWSYEVARRLAHRCAVTVYDRRSGGRPVEEIVDRVRFRHIAHRLDRRLMPWLTRRKAKYALDLPVAASRWYGLGYARSVARDLRRWGCDFAVLFNYSQFAPVIRRGNPRMGLALAMHCEWLSQFERQTCARRLRSVDLVMGCSAHVVDRIRARFDEFAGPCVTLYNGVDVARFATAACVSLANATAGPRILFVGRISPEKGLHVLVDALAEVRKRHPHVVLEIVGAQAPCPREILVDLSDDPRVQALARFYGATSYHAQLLTQIERLGLTRHVQFSGFVPHAEAAARYAAADVLVNPSLAEAFGMSLIEAMAACRPCVATAVGGMPEIVVDGLTGMLAPPDDAPALAQALITLLDDAALRRRMGLAGQDRVRQVFDWDRIAESLLATAEECAGASRDTAVRIAR